MIRYIHSNAERVGAPLAVALNQDGGKLRPYNVGILSYTVTKACIFRFGTPFTTIN